MSHKQITSEPAILPEEAIRYYEGGREAERLLKGIGPMELVRTQELIERFF